MLLCFIVILFICVVVGVIKYSTAHSLKQEKDIKLSTIDNEKFTMEKYYTDSIDKRIFRVAVILLGI